jgi:hypothetical protein
LNIYTIGFTGKTARDFFETLREVDARYLLDIEAEEAVSEALLNAERTYLRIGLARPRQLERYPEACWTQVTGVYTFPDYLEGKTFADFL